MNNKQFTIVGRMPKPWEAPVRVRPGRISDGAETYAKTFKAGRNDPCPCGRGKKYKKCCREDNVVVLINRFNSFLKKVRELVLEDFDAGSCIATTAVICDVMDALDIKCYGLTTAAAIFNEPMTKRLKIEGFPKDLKTTKEWFEKDGSWSVGIKKMNDAGVGHIVAIVEVDGKILLLDGSIDQASRIEKGIVLTPHAMPADAEFLAGTKNLSHVNQDGCLVIYKADPEDNHFLKSPDWTERKRRANIVVQLLGWGR